MSQLETIDVALFPIPETVAFPGTAAPLHVFEPRYRAMIKYCLENDTLLAVSHTRKAIKPISSNALKKTVAGIDELNTNQQSYEAHDVFSAGSCELVETTEDGRMHVIVTFNFRLKMIEIVQQVPFQIVRCEWLEDQPSLLDQQQIDDMLSELQKLIAAIAQKSSPALLELLQQDAWQNLSAQAFSFRIFDYFKFEPDFMQAVLEADRVDQRLQLIWQALTRVI